MADPAHPEHEDMSEWVSEDFDPEAFSVEATDAMLAAAVRPRHTRQTLTGAPSRGKDAAAMLLLIDNYDSFTFNLYHFLGDVGGQCEVVRNDKLTVAEALARQPEAIVLSPGPCTPNEAGICLDLIAAAAGKIPILGVCLGHQAIGQAFGGNVVRAPAPMHGKTSRIFHAGTDILEGMPIALHRHPLPQPDRRSRHLAGRPGRHRLDRGWADHGPPPPHPARSMACSSIRRASPRSTATRCWPTSWRSPAAATSPRAPPEPAEPQRVATT